MTKRIFALFMMILMLCASVLPAFAAETETTSLSEETQEVISEAETPQNSEDGVSVEEAASNEKYLSSKNSGTSYSCVYDSKEQKIKISGSVTHDIFIKHRDYSIRLYKISPSVSATAVLSDSEVIPLATTAISIKFNFTADVKSIEDVFSQYVVVLASPNDSIDFVGPMLYPSVESTYEPNTDRASYKGIVASNEVSAFQSEPAVAVIPVYLDKLISPSSMGYLYSLDGNNVFFDREYIDSLDKAVRNFSDGGTDIYFQLLLNSRASVTLNSSAEQALAKYDIPNPYSAQVLKEIYIYCDFLSDRYSSYKNGHLKGMIIGKNLDDVKEFNNNIYESEDEYTKALAIYGIIVGVATRNNIPSADVAYSFSNVNTYSENAEEREYAPSRMIENITAFLEEHYADDFDFSIVLESKHRPLSISNETVSDGINLSVLSDRNYILERTTDYFVNYLNALDEKYKSAPRGFMYIWNVDGELSGNALASAYSYLYYKLFGVERLTSFVVSFDDSPKNLYDILNILRYIDTEKGVSVTAQLLQFFGENTWSQVVHAFNSYNYATREHHILSSAEIEKTPHGEFYYFDFGVASNTSSWFEGVGCKDVKISYDSLFGRALSARFDFDKNSGTGYSYLLSSFEYPENFAFTPKLDFLLSIEGESEITDIFELKISFHNEKNVYESSFVIPTGSERKISIDLSSFRGVFLTDSIRFSIRPMSEAEGEYSLNISSLKGESFALSSDELEEKILQERFFIRNGTQDLETSSDNENGIMISVMVFVSAIILGVMLFIFLKREEP
ncbi:MAG: hypothetical protein IKB02_00740 [Clostridia bacterium]|nr:hypothetical protein [Clostridia bacterium]